METFNSSCLVIFREQDQFHFMIYTPWNRGTFGEKKNTITRTIFSTSFGHYNNVLFFFFFFIPFCGGKFKSFSFQSTDCEKLNNNYFIFSQYFICYSFVYIPVHNGLKELEETFEIQMIQKRKAKIEQENKLNRRLKFEKKYRTHR